MYHSQQVLLYKIYSSSKALNRTCIVFLRYVFASVETDCMMTNTALKYMALPRDGMYCIPHTACSRIVILKSLMPHLVQR